MTYGCKWPYDDFVASVMPWVVASDRNQYDIGFDVRHTRGESGILLFRMESGGRGVRVKNGPMLGGVGQESGDRYGSSSCELSGRFREAGNAGARGRAAGVIKVMTYQLLIHEVKTLLRFNYSGVCEYLDMYVYE
jgi:hypothetical protein